MQYSCAIWPEYTGGVRGDLEGVWAASDLDTAQLYKLHSVLRKARVKPGDRVLEVGTGWGSLAIEVSCKLYFPFNLPRGVGVASSSVGIFSAL
jgi:cyclopropane-fatty-acyl-phospholipid synthase